MVQTFSQDISHIVSYSLTSQTIHGYYLVIISFFKNNFVYLWLCWLFVAARASLWWQSGGHALVVVWGLPIAMRSFTVFHAKHRLQGSQAQ